MAQSDRKSFFCALDTTNVDYAVHLATSLKGIVSGVKLGLEFFCAAGPAGFNRVAETGAPLFLDLKFHDIPATVAGAIRAVVPLAPKILTIHTQGGPDMMRMAAETAFEQACKCGVEKPLVCGVTLLTSLDDADLASMGVYNKMPDQVERLATIAYKNGLDGIVCSPKEISLVRAATDSNFKLVVPGIRPEGCSAGDQKRVMTPLQAMSAGADVLVIGRPVTQAKDPVAAAKAIVSSLNQM